MAVVVSVAVAVVESMAVPVDPLDTGSVGSVKGRHTIRLTFFLIFYPMGTKFYALKYKNDPKS